MKLPRKLEIDCIFKELLKEARIRGMDIGATAAVESLVKDSQSYLNELEELRQIDLRDGK
jgi:hypothetical protein